MGWIQFWTEQLAHFSLKNSYTKRVDYFWTEEEAEEAE